MAGEDATIIPQLLAENEQTLLRDWMELHEKSGVLHSGRISRAELTEASRRLLTALRAGAVAGQFADITAPSWDQSRTVLEDVSRSHATLGLTPSETAAFVFSLKEPLFALLQQKIGPDPDRLAHEMWTATLLLDKLGLYTVETFQKSREDIIARQQLELLELSTPVVRLWEGILALPLIGTLDSARTQTVMESLLEEIVTSGAEIAIIDITGVPTVDTLVAQHLIKTVAAARLMGPTALSAAFGRKSRRPSSIWGSSSASFRRQRWPTPSLWRSASLGKRSLTEGPPGRRSELYGGNTGTQNR
jgi:rsbT co-antagonist protein RsbR